MSNSIKFISTLSILLILCSCGYRAREAPSKELIGVNGSAIYVFNLGDTVATVLKKEYYNDRFQVSIFEDTLKLGSDFSAEFYISNPNYFVEISSPEKSKIENDGTIGIKRYSYKPDSIGLYTFEGSIFYDTTVVNFVYKFIVVPIK